MSLLSSSTSFSRVKVRTLSAVREAARGQVRMELKAAPAQRAVRCVGKTVPTDEAEREDDQTRGAQELEYEGPELTDGEPLASSLLVKPGAHDQDEDGDRHGGACREGDTSLGLRQLLALGHGAAQEEVVADRGGADQADDQVRRLRGHFRLGGKVWDESPGESE